jgi:hypothetical protein
LALAGGAALVLGGVTVGVGAAAQQAHEKDVLFYAAAPPDDSWTSALAQRLGVTQDKLKQALAEVARELGPPAGPPMGLVGSGVRIQIDPGLGAAANALHISEDQLRNEQQTRSLADIARAHSVESKVVADAIKSRRVADLDAAVRDGKLPAQLAEHLKAGLDQEIEQMLNMPPGSGPVMIQFQRAVSPP